LKKNPFHRTKCRPGQKRSSTPDGSQLITDTRRTTRHDTRRSAKFVNIWMGKYLGRSASDFSRRRYKLSSNRVLWKTGNSRQRSKRVWNLYCKFSNRKGKINHGTIRIAS
jgi:hypothetical protein